MPQALPKKPYKRRNVDSRAAQATPRAQWRESLKKEELLCVCGKDFKPPAETKVNKAHTFCFFAHVESPV